MKKEILAPGNRVLGENREITLIELGQEAIDNTGTSWPYERLDGILITPELLTNDGYSTRAIKVQNGATKTDMVKLITKSDTEFFTISLSYLEPGKWKLEILDKNHQQVCFSNVTFWHTLQNLINAYVLS